MSKRWWAYAGVAVAVVGVAWWSAGPRGIDRPEQTVLATASVGTRAEPTGPAAGERPPASEPEPASDGRFRLLRVVAPAAGARPGASEAVIAVDGLPPKVYRVGEAVVGAVVLQSVQPNGATLGAADGPAAVVLQIAPSGLAQQPGVGTYSPPVIRAASAPPVNREAVPVTDPDHGVDTSNR